MSRTQTPPTLRDHPTMKESHAVTAKPQPSAEAIARIDVLKKRFASVIGSADAGLTTDEIMRMTRGED